MSDRGAPGDRQPPRNVATEEGAPPSAEGLAYLEATAAAAKAKAEADARRITPSDLRPGDKFTDFLGLADPEQVPPHQQAAQTAAVREWESHGSPDFYTNYGTGELWYYDKAGNRVIVTPAKSTKATEAAPAEQIEIQKTATLGRLATALIEIEEAQARAQSLVDEARGLGATWREIGQAANVSPQAAHTRWSPHGREQNRRRQERLRREAASNPDQ